MTGVDWRGDSRYFRPQPDFAREAATVREFPQTTQKVASSISLEKWPLPGSEPCLNSLARRNCRPMHFVLLFLAFVMGGSLVVQAVVKRNLAA
jgi:hypothetical protein